MLLAMAIARPAMPAVMRSPGIAQIQPQKQQGNLRMTPMPLTMPSVRRRCGSKEERSRQVCGDLCLCMAKEVAAAVSVHSGKFVDYLFLFWSRLIRSLRGSKPRPVLQHMQYSVGF